MNGLNDIKEAIRRYSESHNKSPLQVVKALEKSFLNKELNQQISLYKKKKKKVAEITRDLKISHRRFYKILDDKKIAYVKYKKEAKD